MDTTRATGTLYSRALLSATERAPFLAAQAASYGIPAERLHSKAQLPAALGRMLATPGPYLLHVVLPARSQVYPLMEPGTTPQDMVWREASPGSGARVYARERFDYAARRLGRAAHDAAVDVRDMLLRRAEEKLEVSRQDLEVRDGRIVVRGVPDHGISYAELMAGAMWVSGAVAATASYLAEPGPYDRARVRGSLYPVFNAPSFHCHAADVEVDPGTGFVRVRNLVVAQDVGFAVHPLYVEGQMQGGAAQGIGYALTEELHFDDGRIVNPNLALYKLPTTADAPGIKPVIVECPSTQGVYGMKGVGEPPVIFSPAAIANAVFNATGVQIKQTPLTPERVYRAVKGAYE